MRVREERRTDALSLDAIEALAVERFFGHGVLDPTVGLDELDAVAYGSSPLHDFCARVLFERVAPWLVIRERPGEDGYITIVPRFGENSCASQQTWCVRVR